MESRELIENINTSPSYAFIALIIFTFIFHLVLVYPRNLSKKAWKRMDYAWIGLTTLGLFGATKSVQVWLNEWKVPQKQTRINYQYGDLKSNLKFRLNGWVCRSHIRGQFSPDNFEEIVADYQSACVWGNKLLQKIVSIDSTDASIINVEAIPKHKKTTSSIVDFYQETLNDINKLNTSIREKENPIQSNGLSDTDFTFRFFGPLIIILGLSLRITKVTGELLHEK